jgi:hypothetical protein
MQVLSRLLDCASYTVACIFVSHVLWGGYICACVRKNAYICECVHAYICECVYVFQGMAGKKDAENKAAEAKKIAGKLLKRVKDLEAKAGVHEREREKWKEVR